MAAGALTGSDSTMGMSPSPVCESSASIVSQDARLDVWLAIGKVGAGCSRRRVGVYVASPAGEASSRSFPGCRGAS